MKELIEYRRQLMNKLVSATKEFRETCLAVEDAQTPMMKVNGTSINLPHTRAM